MTRKTHRFLHFGLLLGSGLILTSLLLMGTRPPRVANAEVPGRNLAGSLTQLTNADCLGCHGKAGLTSNIGGTDISITVDPAQFGGSVHGANGMSCTACHTGITEFPHPEIVAASYQEYMRTGSLACTQCHTEESTMLNDSIHKQALEAGNPNAPVCTDCHNPHTQTRLKDKDTGVRLEEERVNIPVTCAKCHNEIFKEYLDSVHGAGLLIDGNANSPTCTDCHQVHDIQKVDNAFRLRSPQECAKCHTDPDMMTKYGLSTAVMDTYVSDFHGTTVTIFDKTAPDQETNTPVCVDCHGVHNIARTDDPEKGIQIQSNLIKTCQKCHPDAGDNFSASWMSHYIPSPTKAPLVFYVGLFYKILIPTVIGGMILYVISDIIRRRLEKRKGAKVS